MEIGTKQIKSFSEGLPTTFRGVIKKNVVFMRSENKCAKVGDIPVYATEALYARIMCLMSMGRIQHIDDVLKYELAPIPTALFMETGDINHATSKSGLKNELKVEVSGRHIQVEAAIVDGNALFYSCDWPEKGCVRDLAALYLQKNLDHLMYQDVYLVFDRYHD